MKLLFKQIRITRTHLHKRSEKEIRACKQTLSGQIQEHHFSLHLMFTNNSIDHDRWLKHEQSVQTQSDIKVII